MILGLLGFIGSGKGTVATQLVEEFNFRQDGFASVLKDVCAVMFDWPRNLLEGITEESRAYRETPDSWWSEKLGISNFSPRLALQLVGTDALRDHFHEDIWFLGLQNKIRKNPNQNVVISDVRFPNEIKYIQDQGGTLIQVNRGSLPVWHETALMANKGNSIAREIMTKTYSSAHYSEWAWIGTKVEFKVQNNGPVEELQSQIRSIINKIL